MFAFNNEENFLVIFNIKIKFLYVKDISYAVIGTNGNIYIDLFRDQLD